MLCLENKRYKMRCVDRISYIENFMVRGKAWNFYVLPRFVILSFTAHQYLIIAPQKRSKVLQIVSVQYL